ncbi:hypothetical protein ABVV53_04625 [Novosphingobium sp. RD2P27]|uniref:Uncharacterized protein n=1 Tax=Novosphingobium kalidii TaxID=3230299 RepID=A0ABV2CZA7_9SPHN
MSLTVEPAKPQIGGIIRVNKDHLLDNEGMMHRIVPYTDEGRVMFRTTIAGKEKPVAWRLRRNFDAFARSPEAEVALRQPQRAIIDPRNPAKYQP